MLWRLVKWASLVSAAFIIAAAIWSFCFSTRLEIRGTRSEFILENGRAVIESVSSYWKIGDVPYTIPAYRQFNLTVRRTDPSRSDWWWFPVDLRSARHGGRRWDHHGVALWFALLIVSAPGLWLARIDHRAARRNRTNRCAKCAYDLTGLPAGAPCPECASSSSPSPPGRGQG